MSNIWTPRGTHTRQGKRTWYSVSTRELQAAFPQWKPDKLEAYDEPSGLHVIYTEEVLPPDTRHWLHLSVSRDNRYPSWEDVLTVKEEFIGEEAEAYQILPKLSEYVNIHNNVFHIWSCQDGPLMPTE